MPPNKLLREDSAEYGLMESLAGFRPTCEQRVRMGKLKRWGVAMALAMGMGQAMASSAPATEDQVRQLMEVVGVGKMLLQMNTQAVTTLQQSMPCVQPEFWQNYMDANQTQLFIGRLVPVYQKHFTADEMSGLLKFYRSPLGQKVINEMPTTMAEANQAGQQWSHERSDQMVNELKQMGTLDGSGRCPGKVAASPMGGTALEGAAAIQAAENGEKIKPRQAAEGGEQSESKPAAKATSHSKAAPKKTTKPAPKKTTPAKAPAKPAAKTPAKAEAKSAPAKTDTKPAATTGGQAGQ